MSKMIKLSLIFAGTMAGAWPAQAQVKIGAIASSTGPVSIVGVQQKNTVPLLPKSIAGMSIEYIYIDDNSDPTQATKDVQKLLIEDKVDAIIGPSGSPNAIAVLPLIAEAKTPLLAPVGSAAVVLPMDDKKRWVFKTTQNDDLIAKALIENMKASGVHTLGFIATSDPYGENWARTVAGLAATAGIKIIADERYGRGDTSATGQCLKLLAAAPDAVLIASAGAPVLLPQTTLYDQGYKGKIYQTHGAATPEFLKIGGKKVEGTLLAASLMLVLPEIGDSVPSTKVAKTYIEAYKAVNHEEPGTFGANVYDAGLLLQSAIPKAAAVATPGTPEFRVALRDALEKTHEIVGTQGVYNMTPQDHSGFDERGRVMIVVKDGKWTLAK